jgi:hypothetical protein
VRPLPQPEAPVPPVDRDRVRELVEGLHAAVSRGESIHATAAVYALDALVGSCMAGYYIVAELAHPDGPPPVGPLLAHVLKHAERWAADARRLKDPKP